MAGGVRDRMVAGAVRLLAHGGLQATSFSTVLAETKAPRGSIYHHFPGGKDELVLAAIALTEQHALTMLDERMGAPAVDIARSFLASWRALLTRGEFQAGCALVAIAVGSDAAELRDRAAAAFRAWDAKLTVALAAGGLSNDEAKSAAALLLAASEGAVVICRAEQDVSHFDVVAAQLTDYVRALSSASGGAEADGSDRAGRL
jgi:TetR/AcrR family transcriptional regulator, lmrAB and yxaGH operons repressor